MASAYLMRLEAQHEEVRSEVEGLTNLAAADKRDLTADELARVEALTARSAVLAGQIETLRGFEARAQAAAAQSAPGAPAPNGAQGANAPNGDVEAGPDDHTRGAQPLGGGTQTRSAGGQFTTQDRDPGHYRSVREGGERSFFADLIAARVNDDQEARARLLEHDRANTTLENRALTTGAAGSGIVPPKWLVEEYDPIARQGRAAASVIRNIDLGNDPRPMTLPKQTAGTEDVVAEQTAENDAWLETDEFDTDVDTVAPKPTMGAQVVSRQTLDMTSPAIDQLIYADLRAVYDDKVEAKVCAALNAASGTAVATYATDAAFSSSGAVLDGVIDLATALRKARKRRATHLLMGVTRHGKFRKLKDAEGRRLIEARTYNVVNGQGIVSHTDDGEIEGLPIVATDGFTFSDTFPDHVLAIHNRDALLFEGSMARFRFEEIAGPQSIKLGIWAYTAVLVRQQGKSIKKLTITAAS